MCYSGGRLRPPFWRLVASMQVKGMINDLGLDAWRLDSAFMPRYGAIALN